MGRNTNLVILSRPTSVSQILPIKFKPKLSITLPFYYSTKSEKKNKKSGSESVSTDIQTEYSCLDAEDKKNECMSQVDLETISNNVLKFLNNRQRNHKKKIFMGVKCYSCDEDIYDDVYKCSECSEIFLCQDCESEVEHFHTLIMSRFKIFGMKEETKECKGIFKSKTQNEDFKDLRAKFEILTFKSKQFD